MARQTGRRTRSRPTTGTVASGGFSELSAAAETTKKYFSKSKRTVSQYNSTVTRMRTWLANEVSQHVDSAPAHISGEPVPAGDHTTEFDIELLRRAFDDCPNAASPLALSMYIQFKCGTEQLGYNTAEHAHASMKHTWSLG